MARAPLRFRERDVTAAIKAARKAGIEVGGVEIARDGTIRVIVSSPHPATAERNPWDEDAAA